MPIAGNHIARGIQFFSLPLDGGGSGWGWCIASNVVDTPLPNPPPQGGRESISAITRAVTR
jgi:hypothetical protein